MIAGLAQLAEREICNFDVGRSIRPTGTTSLAVAQSG
jgi:hypothetical protein